MQVCVMLSESYPKNNQGSGENPSRHDSLIVIRDLSSFLLIFTRNLSSKPDISKQTRASISQVRLVEKLCLFFLYLTPYAECVYCCHFC
jgi:hypothetical protein